MGWWLQFDLSNPHSLVFASPATTYKRRDLQKAVARRFLELHLSKLKRKWMDVIKLFDLARLDHELVDDLFFPRPTLLAWHRRHELVRSRLPPTTTKKSLEHRFMPRHGRLQYGLHASRPLWRLYLALERWHHAARRRDLPGALL